MTPTATTTATTVAEVLDAVDAFLPIVRDNIGRIRSGRRLPDDVELAMRATGINRLALPASLGGLEARHRRRDAGVRTHRRRRRQHRRGARSSAPPATSSPATSRPMGPARCSPTPTAARDRVRRPRHARRHATGRRGLHGRWPFVSNCLHAAWIGLVAKRTSGGVTDATPQLVFVRGRRTDDRGHVGRGRHARHRQPPRVRRRHRRRPRPLLRVRRRRLARHTAVADAGVQRDPADARRRPARHRPRRPRRDRPPGARRSPRGSPRRPRQRSAGDGRLRGRRRAPVRRAHRAGRPRSTRPTTRPPPGIPSIGVNWPASTSPTSTPSTRPSTSPPSPIASAAAPPSTPTARCSTPSTTSRPRASTTSSRPTTASSSARRSPAWT